MQYQFTTFNKICTYVTCTLLFDQYNILKCYGITDPYVRACFTIHLLLISMNKEAFN